MDPLLKPHPVMTERRQRLQIENYVLLTESATDLRATHDEFYDCYQPTTPGDRTYLDFAIMSSVQWRRVLGHITEATNHRIRTAILNDNCAAENEVQRYRAMLPTSPGEAILGLKRSALGVRSLIIRWERLETLLERDSTWYGNDCADACSYQGARVTPRESLTESEAGYLTWLYCLMCQPKFKEQPFREIGRENVTPPSLYDREPRDWLGEPPTCRRILSDLVQRQLRELRHREHILRENHEEPARDGAELRRQVPTTPEGTLLLRHERAHMQMFDRSFGAFQKRRLQSLKTGGRRGCPIGTAKSRPTVRTAPPRRGRPMQRESSKRRFSGSKRPRRRGPRMGSVRRTATPTTW